MRLAMIRIPKEMQSLQSEPPETFRAKQLEDDILNWPFVFLGLNGSIYEGGMYHCNLILDKDYPLIPSRILMVTESRRFIVGIDLCLSFITNNPSRYPTR